VKPASKEAEKAKGHGSHDEDISEIAVHQIIETIEFVLGSISNTASYLRLWALSLAHGQLSRVFLEKTIGDGIATANTISIAIGLYFFLNISLGVIMAMDTMECFLHALRLQWVEFDSKFFKADGRKFTPLALDAPLQANAYKLRVEE
jgi:V-type H+-transporting ATPase subunit a